MDTPCSSENLYTSTDNIAPRNRKYSFFFCLTDKSRSNASPEAMSTLRRTPRVGEGLQSMTGLNFRTDDKI